ncbi:hypothetical protein C5167_040194 [Papaver somniferum]|uniref:2,4-dienoyl-CoA reductase [(3E)-enoyl-CoA-producing] n=1 Tax=Papaver somniferum TaxID=3469 RepID=A0A4Y7IGQ2_PAPSO|nr:hypothetical protein C5167_040194 [Papaver somniferum]
MESPFKVDIVKGKVALITGGGSGIGFEITKEFGKHGAFAAIMGRRKSVLDSAVSSLRSLGIQAIGFEEDVRKQEDATRVFDATFEHFGRIDILVNAAAGNFLVPAEDLSPNGFKTVMDIDTVGTFRMCHAVLKYIKKRSRKGDIWWWNHPEHKRHFALHSNLVSNPCIRSQAIDAMTRSLALEWGTDHDIRVNGIAPGPIGGTPGLSKLDPSEMKNNQSGTPLHQFITGEKWDIAMAGLYLASDAAKHINGAILVVDGGDWFNRAPHVSREAVKEMCRTVEKRSRANAPSPESGVPTRSKM